MHRELIPLAFVAAVTIAPLSMFFGCGEIVDTLPHASKLLEESLAFMESVEDQLEMAFKAPLVLHPKGPLPPYIVFIGSFRRCEDIIISLGLIIPIICDTS